MVISMAESSFSPEDDRRQISSDVERTVYYA